MSRKRTPKDTETKVLINSRRICCICYALNRDTNRKKGQIAHLDKQSSNSNEDNLAWLCLDHHDEYDGRTSQSKNFTINEVKTYRKSLHEFVSKNLPLEVNVTEGTTDRISEQEWLSGFVNESAKINIAVYGVFTISDKIINDPHSQELEFYAVNTIIANTTGIYPYVNDIDIYHVKVPEHLASEWGYERLNARIGLNMYELDHLSTIHFYYHLKRNVVTAVINCNDHLMQETIPSEKTSKLINRILAANPLSLKELIELSLNIYFLTYSQVHISPMVEGKRFKELHYTLDGCEKLSEMIRASSSKLGEVLKSEVNVWVNIWLSHINKFRALAFLSEKEFIGAVGSIFKAMSLNPHYPYDSYVKLKENYSKRYAIELIPSLAETQKLMQLELDIEENARIADELKKQIEFPEVSYHYEIVKDIMRDSDERKDVLDLIESELNKLDENTAFNLVVKSEIIRYLKKGTSRVNFAYYRRLGAAIKFLKKAIVLDPDFPILHTKLGSLMILKASRWLNPWLIRKGAIEYMKGFHFFSQLGFKMRQEDK